MKKNLPVTNNEIHLTQNDALLSTTELSGAISYCNDDFLKISGFTSDELIGKSHNIVRHPDMPPVAFADLWSTLKAGKSWSGMVKNRCANGDFYWVDAYATPIKNAEGKTVEYQSVRTKAKPEAIQRAENVYQALNEGKSHQALTPASLNTKKRIFLSFYLLLLPLFFIASLSLSLVTILISFILAIPAVWGLASWLTKPLEQTLDIAKQSIGNNNYHLSSFIYTGRTDEFGMIQMALKANTAETNAIVSRVEESSKILMDTVSNLVSGVGITTTAITTLQEETNIVAVGMEELSTTSLGVAEHAKTVAQAAQEARSQVQQSSGILNETINSINTLAKEVNNASAVIKVLEKDSKAIDSIVSVIHDITEQTNLLALNAAIEAARAGDQGRGFAVVADEVRTLAKRTQTSTEEIKVIVDKLQNQIRNAVDVMEKSGHTANNSISIASQAGESLTQIDKAVQRTSEMVEHIVVSANEQTTVANSMAKNVASINLNAESTVEQSTETKASSAVLAEQAARLSDLAVQFKTTQLKRQQ